MRSRSSLLAATALAALLVFSSGCAVTGGVAYQAPSPAWAGRTDVSLFYSALAPYGRWFAYPQYGWVWTPYDVGYEWRPYLDGRWDYSDAGWTWVADEPWGWGPFHYGRWFFDESYGWIWVPGTVWSPAWVAWRYDGDDVGWAPLPPQAAWNDGLSYDPQAPGGEIPSYAWCFTTRSHLFDSHLNDAVFPIARNATLTSRAPLRFDYEVRDRRPFDRGPDPIALGRFLHHPVPQVPIADAGAPGPATRSGRTLRLFRPALAPAPPDLVPPAPPASKPTASPVAADARGAARRAAEQQRLDRFFAQRRRQLLAAQHREERHPPAGTTLDALRQRHQAERAALERQHQRQTRVLASRLEKGLPPARSGGGRGEKPAHVASGGRRTAHGRGR